MSQADSTTRAHRIALGISAGSLALIATVAIYLLRPGGPVEEARENQTSAQPKPDPSLVTSPAVSAARQSIVRVAGTAAACSRRIEGTGFVFAHERVLTAAHVVAGVDSPDVETPADGLRHPADVVYFDPLHDVAVLRVPGLQTPALRFADTAHGGERAVVAGYPGHGGTLTLLPAWIQARKPAIGPDIYQTGSAKRMVYTVGAVRGDHRPLVQPGDSGGPLLSDKGLVYGMTFAAEQRNPDLGYVLTASDLRHAAHTGQSATTPLEPTACTP